MALWAGSAVPMSMAPIMINTSETISINMCAMGRTILYSHALWAEKEEGWKK